MMWVEVGWGVLRWVEVRWVGLWWTLKAGEDRRWEGLRLCMGSHRSSILPSLAVAEARLSEA